MAGKFLPGSEHGSSPIGGWQSALSGTNVPPEENNDKSTSNDEIKQIKRAKDGTLRGGPREGSGRKPDKNLSGRNDQIRNDPEPTEQEQEEQPEMQTEADKGGREMRYPYRVQLWIGCNNVSGNEKAQQEFNPAGV